VRCQYMEHRCSSVWHVWTEMLQENSSALSYFVNILKQVHYTESVYLLSVMYK
jgi:hypothetical protein